jgi:hypothetical protein
MPPAALLQGIALQVDFKPTSKSTPEEHYAVLEKVGHAIPMPADAAAAVLAAGAAAAPLPPPIAAASGDSLPELEGEPLEPQQEAKPYAAQSPTSKEEATSNASLDAYMARKAARSLPSARSAKKGSDKGRRAAAASAREPLSEDDIDRLGTPLKESR